jgi:hypothetical protein
MGLVPVIAPVDFNGDWDGDAEQGLGAEGNRLLLGGQFLLEDSHHQADKDDHEDLDRRQPGKAVLGRSPRRSP